MVLYLSSMYTRAELALRIGLFYTTASLSGAFGGLLARGLNEIPTTSIVNAGWRWIMIIEGMSISSEESERQLSDFFRFADSIDWLDCIAVSSEFSLHSQVSHRERAYDRAVAPLE
jgi:hypothetical protein